MSHKKHKKEIKETNRSNLYFFIGLSIFLLIAFIVLAPTKTHHYEVEVSYTDTETYTEKEPYETQEAYQVQEPYQDVEYYTDTVPVEQSVPYTDYESVVYNAPSGQYYPSCGSDCTCTDYSFWTGQCIQCTCLVAVTRYKTQIVYQEIQKERPVTKYRTITKYRTVTKYRDVEKTRDVVKTKMDPRQVEVNWLFGFKLPYKLHFPYISEEK
jgi:hypothetical protein